MKKIIISVIMAAAMLFTLCGCGNQTIFDTVYTFDYAIISFPDDTVKKVEIKSWGDYDDSDQLQVIAKDGTIYLVHSVNCVLVKE